VTCRGSLPPAANMAGRRRSDQGPQDPAAKDRLAGIALAHAHPLLAPLASRSHVGIMGAGTISAGVWATVNAAGNIWVNPKRRGSPAEWQWVIAHCLLHLAFGHLDQRHRRGWTPAGGLPAGRESPFPPTWNTAACLVVNRFLAGVKIGAPPLELAGPTPFDDRARGAGAEQVLADELALRGIPDTLGMVGTGGLQGDLRAERPAWQHPPESDVWAAAFSEGLHLALQRAVQVAGGEAASMTEKGSPSSRWRAAVDWVVTSLPLLGGLAAGLRVVEDTEVCRDEQIDVAAVAPSARTLYLNPHWAGTPEERRFVVAHELLHAGLRHDTRGGGRDDWYWNCACDYVINGWLVEMQAGEMPEGSLHDPALRGMAAEAVYDRIVSDLRRYRKLATLRGPGRPDVLPGPLPSDPGFEAARGVDLDEFYRRALEDGAALQRQRGRGVIPAGLAQAIAAMVEPPPPWDVQLGRWFEEQFAPLERRRSYARPSRRQSATPGIPRPSWVTPQEYRDSRTFGVVLDTSGSMGTRLLAHALGAVASYSYARDVPLARVVFCDAAAYDAGYMSPADIAGTVTVRGRGGTVLQPGVDMIEQDEKFPRDGPILIITDGWCDHVKVRRSHAYLIPANANLPFVPRGPVFRMR